MWKLKNKTHGNWKNWNKLLLGISFFYSQFSYCPMICMLLSRWNNIITKHTSSANLQWRSLLNFGKWYSYSQNYQSIGILEPAYEIALPEKPLVRSIHPVIREDKRSSTLTILWFDNVFLIHSN